MIFKSTNKSLTYFKRSMCYQFSIFYDLEKRFSRPHRDNDKAAVTYQSGYRIILTEKFNITPGFKICIIL